MPPEAATRREVGRSAAPGTPGDARGVDHLPVVPDAWVERPRLTALLDAAIRRSLTLVIAPTGAGKTVTLAHWAREHPDEPVRWVNARRDVDVRALGLELLRAAGVRAPDTESGTMAEQIAQTCEALGQGQARAVVVIDDAHLLTHGCYVLLGELLNRSPEAVRLVLLSRWDPPMSLLLLEIQGNVTVVRGDQLRMTPSEAGRLLSLHAGRQQDGVIETVVGYAQGWAAVLVLAGQTLHKDRQSATTTFSTLVGDGMGLVDLLASEVFSSLTERQRHVLLCVSAEETVTPLVSARLSGDQGSGELLDHLVRVGLLVGREGPPDDDVDGQVRYRLHPLLLEVLRRRFATDGVEVMRARAVVLDAAVLDRAHGDYGTALRRMLWVRAFEPAADLVAAHGPDLLVRGSSDLVHRLAVWAPEAIASRPRTWMPMALERLREGDHAGAGHWSQRILDRAADVDPAVDDSDVALVHLLRSTSGESDMATAADTVHRLLESRPVPLSNARRALLLVELGAAETWLGRLPAAATHLGAAVALCVTGGFGDLLPDALSRLGIAELLQGHLVAAMEAARRALALPNRGTRPAERHQARAALVLELARQQALPWALSPPEDTALVVRPQDTDLSAGLLGLLLSARASTREGADGRTVLDATPQLPVPLPTHAAVMLDLERTAYAIQAGDVVHLRELSGRLAGLGASAEAACLEAVLAEIDADLAGAERLLAPVLTGELAPVGPFVLTHALVCGAQIADARGDRDRADALMLEAVRATAPQRYAVPFLGWSFRGTPVPVLLARLLDDEPSAWIHELYDSLSPRLVLSKTHAGAPRVPVSAAARPDIGPAAIPPLTRRENDVLFELSHGSSYADIATSLVITENTVKTHVSSLYAKLGVTRRSQALRAARAAGLA
jgi:LuxR family transcriptional regulator, maltose regulon positive regulatory protein